METINNLKARHRITRKIIIWKPRQMRDIMKKMGAWLKKDTISELVQ
jgi:hypothetical protein